MTQDRIRQIINTYNHGLAEINLTRDEILERLDVMIEVLQHCRTNIAHGIHNENEDWQAAVAPLSEIMNSVNNEKLYHNVGN